MRKFGLLGTSALRSAAGLSVALCAVAPALAQTQDSSTPASQSPGVNRPAVTAPDPAVADANSDDEQVDPNLQSQTDGETEAAEAIVVTGSRIRRDPTNAPTPLIQITGTEILQSGEANVVDFLADIPALSGSVVPEDTTGANLNDGGLSLLNLRDLGSVRTLVLVDGRRHVGASPGTLSVDVSSIPSMLVQSVEVVTGGQSALYGADAVSGVVNFILRRNIEGIEIDASLGMINEDGGALNKHIQGVIGGNFFDDRLNLYAYGAYQKTDEVQDFDIDWKRRSYGFIFDDSDPTTASNDTVIDNNFVEGLRDSNFTRGSILVLANQPRPTAITDPDTPFQNCGAVPANRLNSSLSANCTAIRPDIPGTVFVFNPDGSARPFNFGTRQPGAGFSRRVNIGGDGLNSGTEFGQGSRLPRSEDIRLQAGLNFEITDNLQLFAEAKYNKEETFDIGQPTFLQITIADPQTDQLPPLFGSSAFNIGLDNAFLPENVKTAIRANTRPVFTSAGVQTGTLADPRAFIQNFGPSRSQFNEREVQRYVIGLRGKLDRFAFVDNFSYEIGYTYGEVKSSNLERGIDSERYKFAVDAVRNAQGQVVCRVQDFAARGIPIRNDLNGFRGRTNANVSPTDPDVTQCTPINIFGSDFRADANDPRATGGGGRPGLTQAQADYVLAEIRVTDRNEQHNLLGFVSGELFDGFLPGGPIGLAIGGEYRKESTSGTGRDRDTGDRLLFLNTGPDFPEASYDAYEAFVEGRIPLFKDWILGDSAEVSGAYRYSDYSTVGEVQTYSFTGSYRPSRDIYFRATYGKATRIPNLGENFSPLGQTFANNFTDPCDANTIRAIDVVEDRTNRRNNCAALLGAGYDPGTDTPNTGTRIIYQSGIPGRSGGNPFLVPEDSKSYTIGGSFTPRFFRGFSFTADYYNIEITNAIAAVSAQAAATNCVSGTELNLPSCAVIFRNPASGGPGSGQGAQPFGVIDFIQGALNYAGLEAEGIDFTVRYATKLEGIGLPGRLDYNLRGNYLIRQENFLNIADPTDATENDNFVGFPRVRFLSTLTYSPSERLSFSWDWDWQQSQKLFLPGALAANGDTRSISLAETGPYAQHDFNVSYEPIENLILRAGVVNAFDKDPPRALGSTTTADNFDFFGRRFYVGARFRFGGAVR